MLEQWAHAHMSDGLFLKSFACRWSKMKFWVSISIVQQQYFWPKQRFVCKNNTVVVFQVHLLGYALFELSYYLWFSCRHSRRQEAWVWRTWTFQLCMKLWRFLNNHECKTFLWNWLFCASQRNSQTQQISNLISLNIATLQSVYC